ncbi:MAG TPA: sugar ABC transporter substrate-binding protein [Verrucomicrobiae bacterium]|nr:sugar ABC transporter substrate-binding protein [Verrucomicrobiae bacterium]
MRRGGARGASILVVLALALSCGRRTSTHPVEVTFWQTWPVEAITPLAQRFEDANPGVHIVVTRLPREGATDTLALAAQSGRPPDLVELTPEQTADFIDRGLLSDWSAGVADLKPDVRGWELCSLGDAMYGLPWLLRTRVLLWNRALFARAKLDTTRAPGTWDELRDAAARIEKLGGGVHGFGLTDAPGERFVSFMTFAWGNGGELLSARLDSCRIDSPENAEALEFLLSLAPVSLVAGRDSLASEFERGRLGLWIADAGYAVEARRRDPSLPLGAALVPSPAEDHGTHASTGTGTVLASFTRSRRKEDALRFARYLGERQNTLALAAALQTVFPPHPGVEEAPEYRDRPEVRLIIRQLETAHFEPLLRDRNLMLGAVDSLVGDALAHRRSARATVGLADSLIRKLGVTR